MDTLFKPLENKLKAGAALFGFISVSITGAQYFRFGPDQFALAMTILAFLFVAALLILLVLKKTPSTKQFKLIEFGGFAGFSILLVISFILFAVTTKDPSTFMPLGGIYVSGFTINHWQETRIAALVFQFVTIAIFGWITWILYTKMKK